MARVLSLHLSLFRTALYARRRKDKREQDSTRRAAAVRPLPSSLASSLAGGAATTAPRALPSPSPHFLPTALPLSLFCAGEDLSLVCVCAPFFLRPRPGPAYSLSLPSPRSTHTVGPSLCPLLPPLNHTVDTLSLSLSFLAPFLSLSSPSRLILQKILLLVNRGSLSGKSPATWISPISS
eukprot:scaffold4300_cov36-Tisochrysis_lutea.AAC.1